MADALQKRIEALTELVEEYLQVLELSHYKCHLDRADDCYAEQYGDGTAEDHAKIRAISALLEARPGI